MTWNIILYIVGGIFVLGGIIDLFSEPLTGLVSIFLGFSLFHFFYLILEKKTNIKKVFLSIIRVSISMFLLIIFGIIVSENSLVNNYSYNTICFEEKNNVDNIDGLKYYLAVNTISYNSSTENKKHLEYFYKYVFDNDQLAYNYFLTKKDEWDSSKSEVHLLSNEISILNIFESNYSNELFISNNKEKNFKCEESNRKLLNQYFNDKKKFINEKDKAKEYLENYESNKKTDNNTKTSIDNDNSSKEKAIKKGYSNKFDLVEGYTTMQSLAMNITDKSTRKEIHDWAYYVSFYVQSRPSTENYEPVYYMYNTDSDHTYDSNESLLLTYYNFSKKSNVLNVKYTKNGCEYNYYNGNTTKSFVRCGLEDKVYIDNWKAAFDYINSR